MKKAPFAFKTFAALLPAAAIVTFNSCSNSNGNSSDLQAKVDPLESELKKFTDEKVMTDWTCVIGEMEGTFSKSMPMGNGKTIPKQIKDSNFQWPLSDIGRTARYLRNFYFEIINLS